jgi:hypothetical protein
MATEPLGMCYPVVLEALEDRLTPRFRTIQVGPKDLWAVPCGRLEAED